MSYLEMHGIVPETSVVDLSFLQPPMVSSGFHDNVGQPSVYRTWFYDHPSLPRVWFEPVLIRRPMTVQELATRRELLRSIT